MKSNQCVLSDNLQQHSEKGNGAEEGRNVYLLKGKLHFHKIALFIKLEKDGTQSYICICTVVSVLLYKVQLNSHVFLMKWVYKFGYNHPKLYPSHF